MTIPQNLWNDNPHLFDELKRCIASRWSALKTAKYLSGLIGQKVSRNSVSGKANREGLKFSSRIPKPKKPKRARMVAVFVKPKCSLKATPVIFEGLDLLQLKRNQCHYPQGDCLPYAYCGAPVREGSSYCPDHHKMTHVRPRAWGEAR